MKEEAINTESSSIVVPALISGLVGAGLALLLTPKSGKEIRQDIGRFAKRGSGQASSALEESKATISESVLAGKNILSEGKEQISAELSATESRSLIAPILISGVIGAAIGLLFAPKAGKEVIEDIKDMASSAVEKGKDLYEQGVTAVKDAMEKGKETVVEEQEKLRPAA